MYKPFFSVVFAVLWIVLPTQVTFAGTKDKPGVRVDLKTFGYLEEGGVAEYSSLGFLSDDLLLLAINQRVFENLDPPSTDEPPSTLVVFDIVKKTPVRSTSIAAMKSAVSVAPLTSGEFLVVCKSSVRLCTDDLRCEKSFPIALDRLDRESVKRLKGTGNLVLRSGSDSANGTRSVSSELRYTRWNKMTNVLDIDEGRPENSRRIIVNENQSGKVLFSLQYNPKGHLIDAVLSPNGRRLALVRYGALEIFELP